MDMVAARFLPILQRGKCLDSDVGRWMMTYPDIELTPKEPRFERQIDFKATERRQKALQIAWLSDWGTRKAGVVYCQHRSV